MKYTFECDATMIGLVRTVLSKEMGIEIHEERYRSAGSTVAETTGRGAMGSATGCGAS